MSINENINIVNKRTGRDVKNTEKVLPLNEVTKNIFKIEKFIK